MKNTKPNDPSIITSTSPSGEYLGVSVFYNGAVHNLPAEVVTAVYKAESRRLITKKHKLAPEQANP